MYLENDEGIGPSPISISYCRDYPSFAAEDETKQTIIIFPQKLDLSGLNEPEYSEIVKSKKKSKKPSPIKPYHDSAIYPTGNNYRSAKRIIEPIKSKSTDLSKYRKEIDMICGNINQKLTSNNSISSNTSDRGSSVSSTSSDQRSLSVEINRAKKIISKFGQHNYTKAFEDSNFDCNSSNRYTTYLSSNDSTRPPSSEGSLWNEKEVREEARGEKEKRTKTETYNRRDLISHLTNVGLREAENARRQIEKERKNVATNTSKILNSQQLYHLNSHKSSSDERTLVELSPRKQIEKAFEQFGINDVLPPTYRTEETPILCSTSTIESSRGSLEVARDSHSTNIQHFPLHHSHSTMMIPKEKTLCHNHNNLSLPNLQRFIVRPSTRDIFNAPIDIDQICGKGLKKDLKSREKHFGGSEVLNLVQGKTNSAPTTSRIREMSKRSQSSTIATKAKQRSVSRTRDNKQPPYCSTTKHNLDGVSYSVGAVSQELLGTIKTLYPEWIPLAHKIMNESMNVNIVEMFRLELDRQLTTKQLKYQKNRRTDDFDDEFDNMTTKLEVINRICQKLSNSPNNCPRVQQLKLIQSVLLSA
ncbi:unnamed protein product [Caenorhabditis angaria]|uniref:Uncharacterized protein n=1 Tax=Caenorhabditis angaria TaxID=860376 RepID=A0A9P1I628_9PELO|nr:unnamed protein product [Caenorhabditis angaria]